MKTLFAMMMALALVACEAPAEGEKSIVCLEPAPQERPLCGNPISTDDLEDIRQEMGVDCVAICCPDTEHPSFIWCGPRNWDGGE